jgi:ribonucleoside-diphosphate reductase alpha chain
MEGRYVPSLLAAIGDVIERHIIEIGFLPPKHGQDVARRDEVVMLPVAGVANAAGSSALAGPRFRQCPKCGEAALIRLEDCDQCTSCAYSKCG